MKNFYKSTVLLAAVAALIICIMLLDFYLFHDNPLVFWVTFPAIVAVSGLAIGKLLQIRKNEYSYFQQLNSAIDSANRVALCSFPLPVALISENRRIVWSNDSFNQHFFKPDEDECALDIITEQPLEMFIGDGRTIMFDNRHYRVYARVPQFTPDEKEAGSKKVPEVLESINQITMLFFNDITDFRTLQEEHRLSKPVVMTIMIDTYEDIQKSGRESERAVVTIQIDRLLEAYFSSHNAVLRKISGDRFIVVMEERHLRDMIEQKMVILDMAREIKIKERSAVTLSIGIGRGADNLDENEDYARQALEMALGRGGDQAVIKTESGFEFFGAVSQGSQKYSKVKSRFIAEDIRALVRGSDTVYIMGHSYGDFDSVGSAIGLACAVRRLGVPAYAVVNKEQNASKQLIARFNDYETPVVISPDEAKAGFTNRSLLIIVDTHTIKKLDDSSLFEMADKSRVVVIDHHRLSAGAIQDPAIMWQESNASSAAELVTDLIQYFNVDPILTPLEAEALLAGITLDTKDFVMRSGVATFEAAAFLKKLGADTVSVKNLFASTIENKAKKAEIISSAGIHKRCAIAIVKDDFKDIRVVCSQAADEMLYISGVDAAFTMYPIGENAWSFSARSLGKINVQTIMESMGNKKDDGGGHQSMAGAQLYDTSLEDATQKLYEAIDRYYDGLAE